MMKSLTAIAICLTALAAVSCGNNSQKNTTSETAENKPAVLSGVYKGAIRNDLFIVLSANSNEGTISGTYFYEKNGSDISISGTQENNSVTIREFDEKGKQTGSFTGTVFNDGDSVSGTWQSADGKNKFPFWLKRATDPEMAVIRLKWHFVVSTMKPDPESPGEPPYMEGSVYPVLLGLKNTQVQDALNRQFYEAAEASDHKKSDYASVKEVSGEVYDNTQWSHAHMTSSIAIGYYDSLVLTWSVGSEWDGGAHPSFSFGGYRSVFLSDGKEVTADDLLQGDWRSLLIREIRETSDITDFESRMPDDPCSHIRDTLIEDVKHWTGKQPVYLMDGRIIFIAADNRSFGCPEATRDIVEISIDLERLKPFLRPGTAAARMAEKEE